MSTRYPDLGDGDRRFEQILELLPDAVILHQRGRILYANPAAVALVGAAGAQVLLGRSVLEFLHPLDRAKVIARIEALHTSHERMPLLDERIITLDGEIRMLQVAARRFPIGDGFAVLVVLRDVSDRHRAEQALAEAHEALQVRNRLLSTYHDLVTHDLTNMAMTLLGLLDLLEAQPDTAPQLAPRARRQALHLQRLATNAKILAELLEEAIPRPDAPLPLKPAIDQAVATVEAMHFDRSPRFELELDDEKVAVTGPPFLDAVLVNLYDNAARYAAAERPRIRTTVASGTDRVRIEVEGGTPPSDHEGIEHLLFARGAKDHRSRGSGLGLSVVRELVQLAGGTIQADVVAPPPRVRIALTLPRAMA